jgi:hypothetical protein
MLRLASRVRPAGESPVRVSAGAPGSRPRSEGEIPRAERGVESLFGGSKRVGWDCSLVRFTIGEPSRSCHGEGQVRHVRSGIGVAGPRGVRRLARAHGLITEQGRPVCLALSGKDRSYKPMVKSSGGQRESEGVVVARIGVELKAPGAKGPCFDRACRGGKR